MEKQHHQVLAQIELELSSYNLEEILDRIVQSTKLIVPHCGEVSIVLWDPEKAEFFVSASTVASQPPRLTAARVRSKGGATRWIVDNAQPVVVSNINHDPFTPNPMLREYGFWAYAGVPILTGSKVMGVLYALHYQPHTYSEDEIASLTAAARLAGLAISRTQLLQDAFRTATVDELTGVYRRQFFVTLAEREFALAARLGHLLSCIMLDVDDFKKINDTYGHAIGDEVLRSVASIALDHIRTIDLMGRYGGDEFVILLPGASSSETLQIAERLRRSVESTAIDTDQATIHTTVSLGVSTHASTMTSLAELIDCADQALYSTKQAGRNRVCVFQPVDK